jgi:hypothetical protein
MDRTQHEVDTARDANHADYQGQHARSQGRNEQDQAALRPTTRRLRGVDGFHDENPLQDPFQTSAIGGGLLGLL